MQALSSGPPTNVNGTKINANATASRHATGLHDGSHRNSSAKMNNLEVKVWYVLGHVIVTALRGGEPWAPIDSESDGPLEPWRAATDLRFTRLLQRHTSLLLCHSLFSLVFNSGIAPRVSLDAIGQRGERVEVHLLKHRKRLWHIVSFAVILIDIALCWYYNHVFGNTRWEEETSKKSASNPKSAKPPLRPSKKLIIIVIIQPQIRCRAAPLKFLDRRFQSPNENLYVIDAGRP